MPRRYGVFYVSFPYEGYIRVIFSGYKVRSVAFCKSKPKTPQEDRHPRLLENSLRQYFKGRKVSFSSFSLDWNQGTVFQGKVWKRARCIPYGKTRTYRQIAEAVGKPHAARAVGNALNANPFLILVPCHRVVSKGGLGGFKPGLSLKRALLRLEGSKTLFDT
ncbi:MAG: methylated-DNA--[protein]-cysteine S-methyltransferase [Candidatus Omnitrophica bacterium]|nr:methylated-DNA--[protein]-cysteine S-methyltransferase [Candidatus Omnitrophota bacterium]